MHFMAIRKEQQKTEFTFVIEIMREVNHVAWNYKILEPRLFVSQLFLQTK